MIDSILLFIVGMIVGFIGTVVGVGGGFIVVPFLTLVYNVSPQVAVGTSMCIVAMNSISGAISYARQRRIDYRTGLIFSVSMFPGAFLGAVLLQMVSRNAFDLGFGVFLLCIAAYIMIKQNNDKKSSALPPVEFVRPQFNVLLGIAISFGVGFYSSMAGVGGGLIHVPAMIYLFHFPVYFAVPTSIFILSISSVFTVGSHALVGEIAWTFVPFLGVGAIVGAQIGGAMSKKINSAWLVKALAVLITFAGIRLILRFLQ
jgi:hypothetical protein